MTTIEKMKRALATALATTAALVACGGNVEIGTSSNPLTADSCDASECGESTFHCASGAATDLVCARHGGATCGWAGKCPGDCIPSKCANQGAACAVGHVENLRCTPSPYAGVGSAPADQCLLTFECSTVPVIATCPMAKCKDQGFACSTGAPRNLRCVPDPNAGVGSAPVGQCRLEGDCPPAADASVD